MPFYGVSLCGAQARLVLPLSAAKGKGMGRKAGAKSCSNNWTTNRPSGVGRPNPQDSASRVVWASGFAEISV